MSSDVSLGVPGVHKQNSLRHQVTQSLRSLLISGRLKVGEIYSAPALASEFGVSATPVREAMLDLVREGLVETVRNKGFRVIEANDAELDAMAELRGLIEIPTMAAVARDCVGEVAEAVEALRPLAEEIVEAAAAKDLGRYITLDTEYHLSFLALHGNDCLVDVVRTLRGRARLYGLMVLAEEGTLSQNATEHLEILDAALARDPEAMTRIMTTHIGHVRELWAGRSETPARPAPDNK
ncbi:GntR family transcriptional regulator [Pseudonocardia acaciae]|uniref:GntR family transcriptional regulator n=1 Tax=Pseudonocardia acaciae TaxID=551276 RepID=UPI00048E410B|nr:GntR family transcriptional regulator [Pseudonocardia acaciae]